MSSDELRALYNANYNINKKLFASKGELKEIAASSVPHASLRAITEDLQQQISNLKGQIDFLIDSRTISAAHTLNTSSIHRR